MKILLILLTLTSGVMIFNFNTIKNLMSDKSEVKSINDISQAKGSFYDFKINALDGKPLDLNKYKGKKLVLINVASKCGFTPQYADWEKFHEAYGDKIIVLGFPANNFLKQEPGSNEEIAEFCQKNYGVKFQMTEKVDVIGDHQNPIYKWLSSKDENGWNDQAPSWNFCKYIIDENGKLTHFFASKIKPDNADFKKAVGI